MRCRFIFVSKKHLAVLCLLFALVADFAVSANFPDVQVNGLFRDQAVLTINGKQRILRKGQTSPEGVLLVSASLAAAQIRFEGEERKLALSKRVSGSYERVERNVLTIPADKLGQYRVQITINGQPVRALVDTGASVIAISSAQADRLGIDYLAGQKGEVVTANGRATSFFIEIPEVALGSIVQRNVRAAVVRGFYPEEVLLGTSFLGGLKLTESNGVMSLSQDY